MKVRFILTLVPILPCSCSLILEPLEGVESLTLDASIHNADADQPPDAEDAEVTTPPDADDTTREDVDVDEPRDVEHTETEQVCVPDCAGRACGPNGCGDICGSCREGENCTVDGLCIIAEVDCGDAFEECCDDGSCNNGLCQADWICAPCGTQYQACCPIPPRCAVGLRCVGHGLLAACL